MKMSEDLDGILRELQIEIKTTVIEPVKEHVIGQRRQHIVFDMI